jgi:hypothetical protein
MLFCPSADKDGGLMRVVVLARSMVNLTARMAALHLDGGVADSEPLAKA